MSAAKTGTFLGARYRRHARRRGKQKAIVAGSRTIIETAYRIIADPGFRYIELGSGYHDQLDAGRKTRDKIRQLEKLNPGMTVTLTPRRPDTQPGGPRRAGTRRLTTVRIPPVTRYQRGWRNRLTYYRSSPAAPGSLAPEGGWSLPERTALFPVSEVATRGRGSKVHPGELGLLRLVYPAAAASRLRSVRRVRDPCV